MQSIRTARLRLEPLDVSHAPALFPGLQSPALYEFIAERAPESIEALEARYRRLSTRRSPDGRDAWLNWAMWSPAEGRHVGWVQATVHPDATADVAYVLFRDAWGRGLARESVAALIDHLRDAWHVRTVRATVDPRNRRSIGLLEALGFRRGALRKDAEEIGGRMADEVDYTLDVAADDRRPA